MYLSSSEACCTDSSCRDSPLARVSSPTASLVAPVMARVPPSPLVTVAPRARNSSASWPACGERARTASLAPSVPRSSSSMVVSVISRPRPMMMRRSAVSDISLIRWLDRKMVRPSAASDFSRFLTHRTPSGSRPLTSSSSMRTGGSPSRAAAIPRRCPMPREKPPARRRAALSSPTRSSTSAARARPIPLLRARLSRWLYALRPPWKALASSIAPTSNSGQRNSA